MKQALLTLVIHVFCITSLSSGAQVLFQPQELSINPGTPAVFELTLQSDTLPGFDAADLLIGSNDFPTGSNRLSFTYNPTWASLFESVTPVSDNLGVYTQDFYAGSSNSIPVIPNCPFGTLTIDTTNLPAGDYTLHIDFLTDGTSQLTLGDNFDTFIDQQAVLHIPEPTTILLLILGGLLHRKRIS
jgi:hypothetical protein